MKFTQIRELASRTLKIMSMSGSKEIKQLAYGVLQERKRQSRNTKRTLRYGHELRPLSQRLNFSQRNTRAYKKGRRLYTASL